MKGKPTHLRTRRCETCGHLLPGGPTDAELLSAIAAGAFRCAQDLATELGMSLYALNMRLRKLRLAGKITKVLILTGGTSPPAPTPPVSRALSRVPPAPGARAQSNGTNGQEAGDFALPKNWRNRPGRLGEDEREQLEIALSFFLESGARPTPAEAAAALCTSEGRIAATVDRRDSGFKLKTALDSPEGRIHPQ